VYLREHGAPRFNEAARPAGTASTHWLLTAGDRGPASLETGPVLVKMVETVGIEPTSAIA
jgi:hypothetical protein